MIESITTILGAFLIFLGLFIFIVATVGLFKFSYILNRAHVAAKNDTLATLLIVIGLVLFSGFTWTSLKLIFVAVFLWITNPVATHLITETEVITNKDFDKKVKVVDYDQL